MNPSPGRGAVRRALRTQPAAVAALGFLVLMALLAVFAELVASPLPLLGRLGGHFYILPDVFTPRGTDTR